MARRRAYKKAYKPPVVRLPSLVISKVDMILAMPYNEGMLSDFKTKIPFKDRRWDGEKKVWHLTTNPDTILAVCDLTKRYYNGKLPEIRTDDISLEDIMSGNFIDRSTYYTVLGVQSTATEKEIRKAFFKLAKQYHPDKGGDTEHFHLVREAYEVLTDVNRRKRYDAALRLMSRSSKPQRRSYGRY